ncbi:MAG: translation elongation factor Ts [Furfurilactobacillus sp.]|jgi:elongation factor Ts|uniref:Elongation factor Ts n=1 Tax=Furfurilactobacillus milii TaxID=2888272 RepID=A0A6N9I2D9_9LACO|nr:MULTISPECIES: translation elongation factor Ts [Furfurilactobacillus]QLE66443.1 Translation elongation factor Ts [Furfurilactobacillus rossiae]MCF6159900.1 translation elongation factor Ts [Furfurilactobacillus milii]MCF6162551.1 translation elongation factor Ts [Furfurilactobacillus milii]MCF6419278.1 translation elongation factor Ts [Furfurilactobacillus milii]MCH4010846.1 translation elongation factor Ts [Furfurilactobacillus sp.]
MAVTAAQVKALREKTGVGIMDAKKALVATDGDEAKALDFLREKGIAKAEKKSDRIAAEGLTEVAIHGNKAAIVELNSETDFVASNDTFKDLLQTVSDQIALEEPATVEDALKLKANDSETLSDAIISATQVTGEKISLRRFQVVDKTDDQVFGSYLHMGGSIASLVVLEGGDAETAKDVAMHVAAINPEYVDRTDVPADRLNHEKDVLSKEDDLAGKPDNIKEKMIDGRLNKWLAEISLNDQPFVKDGDQTVDQYVSSKNAKVVSFVRYQVGEGMEKKSDDFVDEVMGQIK